MLILLVLLIFFAALGIPLAFAIGASCVTYILIYAPTFITMLPQRVWNGAYSELMIAMALLAALVIFTVIARYCFSLSWKQLAEFNTTLFAFTTFWGMGINVIKDEHVMIDIIYDGVKPARKRWLAIINYLIVLAVDLVFTYQGFKYVGVAGKQISQGMEIPMMYMYGIMPVCGIICAICVVIKIITLYKADISYFAPKNQALSRDDA